MIEWPWRLFRELDFLFKHCRASQNPEKNTHSFGLIVRVLNGNTEHTYQWRMINERKRSWKAWTGLSFTMHTVNHVTRHSVVIHHTRPASTICWKPGEWSQEPRKSQIGKNSGHRSGSCSDPLRAGYSRMSHSFIWSRIIWGLSSYLRPFYSRIHSKSRSCGIRDRKWRNKGKLR